jgi:hypothetical protein
VEIEPQIELMGEEIKIIELEMVVEPQVPIQVEIIKP